MASDVKISLEGIFTFSVKYVALGVLIFITYGCKAGRCERRIPEVPCLSFLPKSTLCVSFPRRITRLAMEVLKCSGLFVEQLEEPRCGGRTCQSISRRFWQKDIKK